MMMTRTAFALAAVTLLAAAQAQAHAKLLAANPPSNATVAAPKQIVLKFSERLQPRFSGFDISKGGARVPMKATVGKDRMQGAYTFVVR
jgi:methionine-rich copper-binding protein CopC